MRKVLVGMGVIAMAACGSGAVGRMAADGGEVLSDAGQALRDAGEWLADAGARDSGRAQAQDGGSSSSLHFETYQVSCGSDGYASQTLDGTSVIGASVFVCNSSGVRECIGGTWVLTDTALRVPCGQGKDLATITVFR